MYYIVSISGNIFLYPSQGNPILYRYWPKLHITTYNSIKN